MTMISTTGACKFCNERTGFTRKDLDESNPLECRKCGAEYAQAYEHQNRRASMSSRHVKDFYAEGHEVFQVGSKDKKDRMVYSRGEEQRLLEKHGLSPEDGLTPLKDDEGNDIF